MESCIFLNILNCSLLFCFLSFQSSVSWHFYLGRKVAYIRIKTAKWISPPFSLLLPICDRDFKRHLSHIHLTTKNPIGNFFSLPLWLLEISWMRIIGEMIACNTSIIVEYFHAMYVWNRYKAIVWTINTSNRSILSNTKWIYQQ